MNNVEGTRQNNLVTSGDGGLFNLDRVKERHRIGRSDCLSKTQDSAKSKR